MQKLPTAETISHLQIQAVIIYIKHYAGAAGSFFLWDHFKLTHYVEDTSKQSENIRQTCSHLQPVTAQKYLQ